MNENAVIIVAGGIGARMKSDVPKQFIEVNGLPIVMHTINRFMEFDPDMALILVLPATHLDLWEELVKKHAFPYRVKTCAGGETRFHSVKNGLNILGEVKLVGIHDAVRPLVSGETLKRAYEKAAATGNAIPVMPLKESIRKIKDQGNIQQDRTDFLTVQTPQVFDARLLKKAYEAEYNSVFTDDATVVEAYGEDIFLVDGNTENIKITEPVDLVLAEALLGTRKV